MYLFLIPFLFFVLRFVGIAHNTTMGFVVSSPGFLFMIVMCSMDLNDNDDNNNTTLCYRVLFYYRCYL